MAEHLAGAKDGQHLVGGQCAALGPSPTLLLFSCHQPRKHCRRVRVPQEPPTLLIPLSESLATLCPGWKPISGISLHFVPCIQFTTLCSLIS